MEKLQIKVIFLMIIIWALTVISEKKKVLMKKLFENVKHYEWDELSEKVKEYL